MTSVRFPREEFSSRRRKVLDWIGDGACAVVAGAGQSDRAEPFRQTNEFYYLCGVEVPRCMLLMDGRTHSSTLFLPRRDPRHERNEGPGPAAEDEIILKDATGFEDVRPIEDFPAAIESIPVLYVPHSPAEGAMMYRDETLHAQRQRAADPWRSGPSAETLLQDWLRRQFPSMEIRDLSPALDSLRLIKSPLETERMRAAGRLTALAICEAMRCTRPGVTEYQLGAVADYVFGINGSKGGSYRPIIAAGENIWYTHYWQCSRKLEAGDVVLMDYAPDYEYYTSDIGRTWPVNGRFSEQQRELYGFVTEYHKTLLRTIRPGVEPVQILEECAEAMRPIVEQTRFSRPVYESAARKLLEFKGHLSHPVGMAVHDVGSYWHQPLQPGLVISIDPQMWIPEENLYIRVEDTVVVTESGIENLTELAPLDLDEIEPMVGTGGVLQSYPVF